MPSVFLIDDNTIKAVHGAYAKGGELRAVVELRERYPALVGAAALHSVRRILMMDPDAEQRMMARLAALKAERQRVKRGSGYIIRWP
jgi:hypothetical protein